MSGARSVAIVGGGFTGLTAAFELSRDSGLDITLIERGAALGGLAGDFALQGSHMEKAYHHLFRSDTDILDLVNRLGLDDDLMWCDSSVGIFYEGKTYPFTSPWDLLSFTPCDLITRLRVGAVAFYLQKKKDWRHFKGQTAYAWMRRACGPRAMQVIWEPLLRGKFDRQFDSVSMAWLWARIHIRANSRQTPGAEKLGYFRGGFAVVTAKLESELAKAKVRILKNCTVESLKISAGRPTLVLNGRTEQFDRCIFTGPSPAFARLLPADRPDLDAYRQQLESISYLGCVCFVFVSDQDVGDYYWLNVNQIGAPFLVFINHTKMVDRRFYNSKHVYYIASYQRHDSELFGMEEDAIVDRWLTFLQKMYPHFDRARVIEQHLFKLKYAQHIVDTNYESRIPGYKTPLPGVYLANFSQVFPEDRGTNYAVREGNRIAELVRKEMPAPAEAGKEALVGLVASI